MKLASFAIVAATAALLVAPASAQTVGMATSPPGSFYHTVGSVFAGIVAEKSKIQLRIQPFTSPNIFLPALSAGEQDFGLANVYEVALALNGDEFYQGRKNPNLRMVTIVAPLRSAFFVRKDSPIRTLTDLKGKRVPSGYAQQKIIQLLGAAHFDAVGLKEADFVPVPVPAVVRGADDFAAGRADVFFFALGSGKVTEVDAAVGGIRALPLPDNAQTRASFDKNFPPAYVRMETPMPGLAGIVTPTPVMAYDSVLVTNSKVSDDVVYALTKVLHDNAEGIQKASATVSLFARNAMAKKTDPIEYHPGAIKFYREKGLWPPKMTN